MVTTYEDVIPSLIENTTMQKVIVNGVHRVYYITPVEGYVMHDKAYDTGVVDPETAAETGEFILGYRTTTASCSANYDFVANPREFYTVPENSVPADQIFGSITNNPEIA